MTAREPPRRPGVRTVFARILWFSQASLIRREFDADTGIIYVVGEGVWQRWEVDRHYRLLGRMIRRLRRRGRPIRLLSDVSRALLQDPELERHILVHMASTFKPGDRVAVLVADAAKRAHVMDAFGKPDIAQFGFFSSRIPAEQWLLLDEVWKSR